MTRRLAVPLAAIALLGVSLAPASGEAPSGATRLCEGGSDAVLKKGRWTLFAKPEGLTRIIAHAEDAGGDTLYVTDGSEVARSSDAGCSWKTVYDVATPTGEGTPADGVLPRVSRLSVVPETGTVLLVVGGVGGAAASQVLRSDAAGDEGSWEPVEGLPPLTGVREIVAPADSGTHLYLVTGVADAVGDNEPAGASGLLYRSDDDGATWTALGVNGEVAELAVEPDTDGRYLWIVRANGSVLASQDAGATFIAQALPASEDPDAPADHWRDVAVFRFVTVSHAIVLTSSASREADVNRVIYSADKGRSWHDLEPDSLGPAGGLVFGNAGSQLYSAGGSNSTAWRGPGLVEFDIGQERWRSADDLNLVSLFDARRVFTPTAAAATYHSIFLRAHRAGAEADDALVRFEPPPPPEGNPSLAGYPECGNFADLPAPAKGVTFEPSRLDVQLTPGEPARLPVKAAIASAPASVDVAFLVDNSNSMKPAYTGVQCSMERLVRELPERHLNSHFALSHYSDVNDVTYERLVDMAPPKEAGPAIATALQKLMTRRGEDEPLRGALFQLATGAGLDVQSARTSSGLRFSRKVPAGQQINWRPEGASLRTVIVLTDEPYEDATEGEPPIESVIAELKARGIHVIGLPVIRQVAPTDQEHSPVRQLLLRRQLDEIARATGALAPKGGIDCDGGGTPDIPEGGPIVCPIDERGIKRKIDDTLVGVLAALAGADRRPVRMVPRKTSGLSASVEGDAVELDLRQPNDLQSTAVLGCTSEQEGRRFDVSFDVVAGGERVLDTIEGTATCGALPAAVVPPLPPKAAKAKPAKPAPNEPAPAPATKPAPPQPAAAPAVAQAPQPAVAAAPPPPPPAPAPVNGAPATSSAPANAAVAQPGVTMQEERKPQINLAKVGAEDAGAADHAMVRSRPVAFAAEARRGGVPTEALVTLGVGLSALFVYVGVAAAPRRRPRPGEIRPARVDVN